MTVVNSLGLLKKMVTPHTALPAGIYQAVALFWTIFFVGLWMLLPAIFPSPLSIVKSFEPLWMEHGLGYELVTSLYANAKAIFFAMVFSLLLAYLSVLGAMRPVVDMIAKGRFLPLTGLTFLFTYLTPDGHWLKVSLLTFGMSTFYITTMAEIVRAVPKSKLDHARTLRMGKWHVVWEVVVLGQFDQALESLRQNAAIGWAMLTFVEALTMYAGGVGTLLFKQSKFFKLAEIYAVLISIFIMGLCQDWSLRYLKNVICPYASMKLEQR